MPKPSLNSDGAAIQITRDGASWSDNLGQATTVSFAFRTSAPPYDTGAQGDHTVFNSQQIAISLLAFQAWSDVARINFSRVGSGTSGPGAYSDNASILLGAIDNGADYYRGFAYLPGAEGVPGDRAAGAPDGDVYLNNYWSFIQAPALWNRGFLVLTHEIGHALGLDHPGDYNRAPGVDIIYEANAEYAEDTAQYSVMSYFSETYTGGDYHGLYPAAPQLHDIAAAQRLYGANTTTRTGDTVYGFNSNAARPWFEAAGAGAPLIFAAWDAGGRDTFDFSGYSQAQRIDLGQNRFSDVGGMLRNVAVADGAVIENALGGSGADSITGNEAANRLSGRGGVDQLYGLGGDDTLAGGALGDRLDGGLGVDIASYAEETVRLVVDLAGAGPDTLVSIEGLMGGAFGDELAGNAAANTLLGGAGDDVLQGRGGLDRLDGGAGTDTASYAGEAARVIVDLSGAAPDTLISIEAVLGTAFDDILGGDAAANTLAGGAGDDVLEGRGGNDRLDGGAGEDTARFLSATGGVAVDLAAGTATGDGTDTLLGIEHALGGGAGDTLLGSAAANHLRGGSGDDLLDGGAGADTLDGGEGLDTVRFQLHGSAAVIASLSAGAASGAGADVLTGIENLIGGEGSDALTGNALVNRLSGVSGADTLNGLDGADILDGGSGGDRLAGGAGADRLTGGSGLDIFVYGVLSDSSRQSRDRILDLQGRETVDLSGIDADASRGGNQAFVLVDRFSGEAGELTLTWRAGPGETWLRGDTDGDGSADLWIKLDGDHRDFEGLVL